jgi:hypothetical protein
MRQSCSWPKAVSVIDYNRYRYWQMGTCENPLPGISDPLDPGEDSQPHLERRAVTLPQ